MEKQNIQNNIMDAGYDMAIAIATIAKKYNCISSELDFEQAVNVARNGAYQFRKIVLNEKSKSFEPTISQLNFEAPAEDNTVFDCREAADYLHVHFETIRRASRRGELPSFRVGKKLLFRKTALDAWLQSQEVACNE